MDESSIQVLREDLPDECQALESMHTTAIGNFLDEFNDDQLLLVLETKFAFKEAASG